MPFCAVLSDQHQSQDVATQPNQAINASAQALRHAAAVADLQKVQELCRKSVPFDADVEGRTALMYAAASGHTAIVKELIKAGANVNARDAQFNTAFHEAAWKGYSQTIEILTKNKANGYLQNKQGHTALHLACQQGHNQSTRILLLNGIKPDIKNNFGDTPLHSAARYGHAGVARILISAFCNVNEVNKNGDTALHISTAMGRRKLTKILLEAGCNATISNKQGETAMDIALRKSYTEVQDIIANPPPLKLPENHKCHIKSKREKESSQGSKSSGKVQHDKLKKYKAAFAKSVHFSTDNLLSPYGCHMHPNTKDFPKPNLDSLPSDPLNKGEQYYIDLAGNIRKGPIGKGYKCYCGPLLKTVEKKMEKDKLELIGHIDTAHESLNEKISSLERNTKNQLVTLSETVQEKLALESLECRQRVTASALREQKERFESERRQRLQGEQLKAEVKSWLDTKLHTTDVEQGRCCDQQQRYQIENNSHVHNKHRTTTCMSQVNAPTYQKHSSAVLDFREDIRCIRNTRSNFAVPKCRSEMCLTGSDYEEEGDYQSKIETQCDVPNSEPHSQQTTCNTSNSPSLDKSCAKKDDVNGNAGTCEYKAVMHSTENTTEQLGDSKISDISSLSISGKQITEPLVETSHADLIDDSYFGDEPNDLEIKYSRPHISDYRNEISPIYSNQTTAYLHQVAKSLQTANYNKIYGTSIGPQLHSTFQPRRFPSCQILTDNNGFYSHLV